MQIIRLASVALIAGSLTHTMAYAAYLAPSSMDTKLLRSEQNVVLVAAQLKKKSKAKSRPGHNYTSGVNSSLGYIPGFVPTPYGRGDCIGWWEPLGNGLMRCHGQFIREH
jgi:hypothetical protein